MQKIRLLFIMEHNLHQREDAQASILLVKLVFAYSVLSIPFCNPCHSYLK